MDVVVSSCCPQTVTRNIYDFSLNRDNQTRIKFQLATECNLAEVRELREQSQAQRLPVKSVADEIDVSKCNDLEGDDDIAKSGTEPIEDSTEAVLDDYDIAKSGTEPIEDSTEAVLDDEKAENLKE